MFIQFVYERGKIIRVSVIAQVTMDSNARSQKRDGDEQIDSCFNVFQHVKNVQICLATRPLTLTKGVK